MPPPTIGDVVGTRCLSGCRVLSLRRHDPDQLLTVGGRGAALSAQTNGLPLITDGSARACDTVGVDRRARLRDARLYFVCRPRRDASAPSRARWPAASTSSSCATRTPPRTSSWPPPRPRARCCDARRRALPAQRPPRPRGRLRRRRRACRPGRHAASAARANSSATTRSSGSRRTRCNRRSPASLRRGLHRRRARARDADQAWPARRSASSRSSTPRRTSRCRGSRSAASTPAPSARVVRAGARRVVVVRAIAQADDPEAAARTLRAAVTGRAVARRSRKRDPARGRRSRRRRPRRARPADACAVATRAPRSATPRCARSSSRSRPASGPRRRDRGRRRRRCWRSPTSSPGRPASTSRASAPAPSASCSSRRHARSPPWACGSVRYWAVLGFEALLGDHARASPPCRSWSPPTSRPSLLCVAIIGPAGWLFWKLVRVMGRLQAAAARSLDSGALWLTPSTTASSSAPGPGGYVAAIRAAQLGMKTAVIEKDVIGGRCLNYACIPAKAVLRVADVLDRGARRGRVRHQGRRRPRSTSAPSRSAAPKVVKTLTGGVGGLFKKNKIDYIEGHGALTGAGSVRVGSSKTATRSTRRSASCSPPARSSGRSRAWSSAGA